MNQNLVVRNIKKIKRELTNLKTAHDRPLGTLDFFNKSINFTVNLTSAYGVYVATIDVVVNVETPTVTPPIVQTGWDTPSGFLYVEFMNLTISNDYSSWTYKLQILTTSSTATATMKVGCISSQKIESITWSYT